MAEIVEQVQEREAAQVCRLPCSIIISSSSNNCYYIIFLLYQVYNICVIKTFCACFKLAAK